jgi:hypothetical protein
VVVVNTRNLARDHFSPNRLSYRLRDSRGALYFPDIGGGMGPSSLSDTGSLERGEAAKAELAFRVPRSRRRLSLVFEPTVDGPVQVRVPLAPP